MSEPAAPNDHDFNAIKLASPSIAFTFCSVLCPSVTPLRNPTPDPPSNTTKAFTLDTAHNMFSLLAVHNETITMVGFALSVCLGAAAIIGACGATRVALLGIAALGVGYVTYLFHRHSVHPRGQLSSVSCPLQAAFTPLHLDGRYFDLPQPFPSPLMLLLLLFAAVPRAPC